MSSSLESRLRVIEDKLFSTDKASIFNAVRAVTRHCQELTDEEKSELWFKIDRLLIARFCLGKVPRTHIDLIAYLRRLFPQAEWQVMDDQQQHYITLLETQVKIAKVDFTYRLPYILHLFDCENFANKFQDHMADHYNINGIPVIHGWPPNHGFNLLVGKIVIPEDMPGIHWPSSAWVDQMSGEVIDCLFYEPQNNRSWTWDENEAGKTPFGVRYDVDKYFV